ncbi:calcium-binding protein [Cognatishimia sp. F0-27]|uniref:calcium-binding protein n=1 Tax=Cognatishimia sp. F0-27 TaxID=2816855 RepID=UPI001D0C189A|nr:calcium-binding protein [Cognatishimia sp. F0-27]MCC1491653.1 hypothetical protein [Cognatishimia sp. F0-27]
MASFNLFGNSSIARTLAAGEQGFIANGATLSVLAGTAVAVAGDNVDIIVSGGIQSRDTAINTFGYDTQITVGPSGYITSSGFRGIDLRTQNGSNFEIANAGLISAPGYGIGYGAANSSHAVRLNLINSGDIFGITNTAVAAYITVNSTVQNTGTITGLAYGIDINTNANIDVWNSGTITGNAGAIALFGNDSQSDVYNSGTLNGGVFTARGDDMLVNTGLVIGDAEFGQDQDLYDGRFGTITGYVDGGDGDDTILGGEADDDLRGQFGNDLIRGREGDDTVTGGEGEDTLSGNDGNDSLLGDGENDTLMGGDGDDVLNGGNANDRLEGGKGADTLIGGAGDDRMEGGAGDDTMNGSSGTDTIIFPGLYTPVVVDLEAGTATNGGDLDILFGIENVFGSAANDTIVGSHAASNRLEGSDGDDDIFGLDGNDTILGGNDDDRLYGDNGGDRIFGGFGDDFIDGGPGRDLLEGGPGADNFVFRATSHTPVGQFLRDEVRDFDDAEGDIINLFLIDANVTAGGNQAFTVVPGFTGSPGELTLLNTVIGGQPVTIASMDTTGNGSANGQIYINGTLDASDFLL